MNKLLHYCFTFTLILASGSALAKQDASCLVTRAAFDIGSGSTKMKVAEVNHCLQTINKILLETTEKVDFKEDLNRSKQKRFSPAIQATGRKALQKLITQAKKAGATSFAGVATSAFRDAKNGKNYLNDLSKEFNMKLRIIDQNEEGRLGFAGAAIATGINPDKAVVWDIGGGSMQFATRNKAGKISVFGSKLASVSFRDYIIKKVQKKSLASSKTPNPISNADAQTAKAYARIQAAKLSKTLKQRLSNRDVQVIGIGGVHYYSVRSQVKMGKTYTRKKLAETIQRRVGLADKEIGGKYASTDASNLILVNAFMGALNIKQVKTTKVNLTDGVLVQSHYF